MDEIRAAILTVSDRSAQGLREDGSGPALAQAARSYGWHIVDTAIVADEQQEIIQALQRWLALKTIDLILTTGGTGFAPRDVTPEATARVIQRAAPGLAEAMRQESLRVTPHAMLSRGIAGICDSTIIINLPGSPKAAVENLQVVAAVLPHAVALLREQPGAEAGHSHAG